MPSKNANGAGTIHKRADGRWEARYTVGINPSTGKALRKSVYGKTQKEVQYKLSQAVADIQNGEYFEASNMTLKRWIEIWLAEYMGDKKYGTVRHYKSVCEKHIIPALGAVKLSKLTTPQIQTFYNHLKKDGRIQKDGSVHGELSAKTVRNIHVILNKCLSTAIDVGYIKYNPAERATLPKVEKKEIHPLTDEQVKQFMKLAPLDEEYGTEMIVILFTGLRLAEASGLTWDCIDFKNGTMKVYQQLQKRTAEDGKYALVPLKNDKPRYITPAPFVMELLQKRRKEQIEQSFLAREAWQAWHGSKEKETALIFTTALGDPINPKRLYLHYKKIADKIGIPYSRVHDLRHTFAVLSLQNGDDVKTVQENLGHATASFTLDIYGHVSERMRAESANRMQAYIQAVSAG